MPHRPTWPCAKHTELKTFMHQEFYGTHLGTFGGQSILHISNPMNFIFSQNTPPSHLLKPWHTDQLGHVQNTPNSKHSCTKKFRVLIWGHLRPFQPSHLKNHEFHFFHKNNPPSHLPMPCYIDQLGHVQKNTELKASVHQEFYGTHLGTLGGHSNLYISKTMNFIFSQNTPPSLSKPCHTDQLSHVQNTLNSIHSCTKNFMLLIWGHLEANPTFTSQKP